MEGQAFEYFDPTPRRERIEPGWKRDLRGGARRYVQAQRHQRAREYRETVRNCKARGRRQAVLDREASGRYRKNRSLIQKKNNGIKTFHRFPKNFDLIQNYQETISWLTNLRSDLTAPAAQVYIDHSQVDRASPESLLILIAEMTRAQVYSPSCNKVLNMPPLGSFRSLASALGYLQHFSNGISGAYSGEKEFLRYFSGRKTLQKTVVKPLVDHFAAACSFDLEATKALKVAIGECMTNVKLHAYDKTSPCLLDQWWLLGYRDMVSHEISFSFYDQGRGIPSTIRARLKDQIPVVGPSDSDMIAKGIQGHYSRSLEPARGSGLPTLVEFIDKAAGGELLILSRKGRYSYKKGMPQVSGDVEFDLPGTLIVWTLRT